MRLIFSRKGFDSSYGGGVSPILPDGTMVTIPIPETGSGITYGDLKCPRGSLFRLMNELGTERYREGGQWRPLTPGTEAHLDPDLWRDSVDRHSDWRPVFGQCEAAQSVLANRGVSKGDLFLFYGTFRHTTELNGELRYYGKPFHAIFGYMLVGDIVYVNGSTSIPWCSEHPHLANRNRKSNALYIAADSFLPSSLQATKTFRPGSGMLQFDQRRVLSKSTDTISVWSLPRYFHPSVSGKVMSSNGLDAWTLRDNEAIVKTKSPGQEYVMEVTRETRDWAVNTVIS